MATYEKRDSGWCVRVRKAGINKSATFPTKHQAQSWAAKIEGEIYSGMLNQSPDRSFAELIERYKKEITPTKRGARAEEFRLDRMLGLGKDRDGKERHPDPLALVRLQKLGPEHIGEWRDRRQTQVSVASMLRELATLAAACNVAVNEWRWLQKNPCTGLKKPPPPKPRTRRLSHDEIERLILAAGYSPLHRDIETQTARVGAALLFAIETAMRAGEICNLTWEHVDLDRRVAHLPKTKNGHARDVPLSLEAVRILNQLKGHDPVFGLTAANLDALFRKLKARALITGLHFHDSRAEALTRMATPKEKGGKGIDVMTLAKISGHRDLRILLNTYYRTDMSDVAGLLD